MNFTPNFLRKSLRNKIITKGYNLAKDSSLSIQTAKIIEHIKNKI